MSTPYRAEQEWYVNGQQSTWPEFYKIAARLLLAGEPVVRVMVGLPGPNQRMLQEFCPADCSVAPEPHWSTSAFPPWFWRSLGPQTKERLLSLTPPQPPRTSRRQRP